MPRLDADVVVVERDVPGIKEDVEEIFSKAKRVHFSFPTAGVDKRVGHSNDSELVGVGKVRCSYAVAGAWNVAAKCEVVSDDGDVKVWMGWVFDYTPHGSDEGTESPARFSYCFSPDLYKSGVLEFAIEDLGEKFGEKVKSAKSKYVCIEGWVDNPDYFLARSKKAMGKLTATIDEHLSDALL